MLKEIGRWLTTFHMPSYVIFFVTARCNAACKMCFYKENMESNVAKDELTVEEYEKISKSIKLINILGISGGEPFLRDDLHEIIYVLYQNCSPLVVDLPTNGYWVDRVLPQVESIAAKCPQMIVDLQLSIDGPSQVHDDIRQLKGSFEKVKQTYQGLIPLKRKYKNLRVKGCVVYSHYNQHHVEELFDILARDFRELDRIVFSVVHGSVTNHEAFDFSWDKYFQICDKIRDRATVQKISDLHSVFTLALRMVKNDFLKEILKTKDMYRYCKAGTSVVVINEKGEVFPCEPLWKSVGNLRETQYDLQKILKSDAMKTYCENMVQQKCHCHWGLPMSNSLLFTPRYYPQIIAEMGRIVGRSMTQKG